MAKSKRMDQIKDILSTYASCKSVKETARRLRVSRNTVRRYLCQAEQAGLVPPMPQQAPSQPPRWRITMPAHRPRAAPSPPRS